MTSAGVIVWKESHEQEQGANMLLLAAGCSQQAEPTHFYTQPAPHKQTNVAHPHTHTHTCRHCEAGMSHTRRVQSMPDVNSQRQSELMAMSVRRSLHV